MAEREPRSPVHTSPRRPVRSYVRRGGRLTRAQARALEQLLPRYGVAGGDGVLDWTAVFGDDRPVVIEVGFGNGETLAAMAAAEPEHNFLGIEVHRPGIGHLLLRLQAQGLDSVRMIEGDAFEVLRDRVAAGSVRAIRVFFPDPWPKRRHWKRRLVQAPFVRLAVRCLAPGGELHLATDWEPYAGQMLALLDAEPGLANAAGAGCFSPRPASRPVTRFEHRGCQRGHRVRDLLYHRVAITDPGTTG